MKTKLKCVGVGLLITLSFVIFIGIVSSVAMMTIESALNHVVMISGISQILYLVLAVSVLKIKKADIKARCGVNPVSYKAYLFPILAALCFSASSNIIQAIAPIPEALIGGVSENMGNSFLAFILSIFIVAPVVEEFVFRGLILTKLLSGLSEPASVLISALLFAAIHAMAGGIVTIVHAFLGGLIFALTYEKTRSLFPAILAHIFGNIGGYVPTIIYDWSALMQYIFAALLMAAAVMSCMAMLRKKISSGVSAK